MHRTKADESYLVGDGKGPIEAYLDIGDIIRVSSHALQCRVTTEDPENSFVPDYGRITAYRSPAGFGIIMHPRFAGADYTTKFIDETPALFQIPRKRDRATRLLSFIGDVIVNGNSEVKGRAAPKAPVFPRPPRVVLPAAAARGAARGTRAW